MTNEVAVRPNPFGGKVALRGAEELLRSMQDAASDGALGSAPDGSDYLNFSGKRGVYEFGKEKENITSDEVWAVNVESFQAGWVCWKGGSNHATRLASIYGVAVPEPDMNEFGPFNSGNGEGWYRAKAVVLRSVDADDRQAYFKVNSRSAVAAVADLQQQIVDRMANGQAFWPLVQMGMEKFQAKGNWNYKPTITVYGWLSTANLPALADPEADLDELIKLSAAGEAFAVADEVFHAEELAEIAEPEVEEVAAAEVPRKRRRANL